MFWSSMLSFSVCKYKTNSKLIIHNPLLQVSKLRIMRNWTAYYYKKKY